MTYLDYLEQKVLLERLVIGLEEPVLIKGLGELSAKIDSGNGGYNVIHGTDFHQQGDELMFTTHDSNGNQKKIQAKVIDTIEINMGGGNIESRPVIELDIKFAGEDYKKIPFSVSDRSSNTNPILISKGFVENELEALIDVGAMNISHQGIDVVYGEGIGGFLKGAAKMAGKGLWGAAKTAASGVKNAGKWLQGGSNVSLLDPLKGGLSMAKDVVKAGVGVAGLGLGALIGGPIAAIVGICKLIKNPSMLVNEDIPSIKKTLPNAVLHRQLHNNENIILDGTIWKEYGKTNFKNLQITPVVSFKGRTGDVNKGHVISGMEERIKNWKTALKDAEQVTKDVKGNNGDKSSTQEQEQDIIREAYVILTEDVSSEGTIATDTSVDSTTQPYTPEATATTADTSTTAETQSIENSQEKKEITISDEQSKLIQETATDFKELSNFILYFVPASIEKSKESVAQITKIFTDGKLDQFLSKLFNIGTISKSSVTPIIKDLAKTLKSMVSDSELQGSFVIATGDLGKRKIELFDKVDQSVYRTKKDESQVREGQTADPEIVKLAQEKFQNLEPLIDDVIAALNDQNVLKLTSPKCQSTVRKLISKSGGDLTKERDWVERNISQYENNGEIPTAIIKNYINKNGLTEISTAIEKKYGKNWKVTDFDTFVDSIAKIDGISETLNKIGNTSAPAPEQIKSPSFDSAQQEITSQIDDQSSNQTDENQSEQVSEDNSSTESNTQQETNQSSGESSEQIDDNRTPKFNEMQKGIEKSISQDQPTEQQQDQVETQGKESENVKDQQVHTSDDTNLEKQEDSSDNEIDSTDIGTQPNPQEQTTDSSEEIQSAEQTQDEPQQEISSDVSDEVTSDESEQTDIQTDEQDSKSKLNSQNHEPRIKSRAQMNAHARRNKKAHMKKGKKKGSQSEEEPWIQQEEDQWIKSKLQYFRNKGLI